MRLVFPLVVSLLLPCGLAAAQPAPQPAAAGPGAEALRQQVRERMRTLFIWRVTEALNLDEMTAQRLFPLLHRYEERLQPLRRSQMETMGRLRTEVESVRPDPGRINQAVDALLATRKQIQGIEEERTREVRKVLTPVQQARLVLALPRIERELRQQVRRAVNPQARGAAPQAPFPPDEE